MTKAQSPRFICRTVVAGGPVPQNLCPEAAAMVAEQTLPARTAQALEKMSPARQVEAVSIMVRQDNLTGDFARALLAATPASMRVDARMVTFRILIACVDWVALCNDSPHYSRMRNACGLAMTRTCYC